MSKKLFAVEVTYKAYVLAEDTFDAENFVSEITDTESYPDVQVDEVDSNVLGWDLGCCIYHVATSSFVTCYSLLRPPQVKETNGT